MQDRPDALEIVDAVIERLSSTVAPQLEGRVKFEVRVAVRALQLARREFELGAASDTAEREGLATLLGAEATDDLGAANRRLCAIIDGEDELIDESALAAHLRATTLAKLAVDQPDYPPLVLARTEGA